MKPTMRLAVPLIIVSANHTECTVYNTRLLFVAYLLLCNNQINARALIGLSAVGYCAGKPTEKSRVFSIII